MVVTIRPRAVWEKIRNLGRLCVCHTVKTGENDGEGDQKKETPKLTS